MATALRSVQLLVVVCALGCTTLGDISTNTAGTGSGGMPPATSGQLIEVGGSPRTVIATWQQTSNPITAFSWGGQTVVVVPIFNPGPTGPMWASGQVDFSETDGSAIRSINLLEISSETGVQLGVATVAFLNALPTLGGLAAAPDPAHSALHAQALADLASTSKSLAIPFNMAQGNSFQVGLIGGTPVYLSYYGLQVSDTLLAAIQQPTLLLSGGSAGATQASAATLDILLAAATPVILEQPATSQPTGLWGAIAGQCAFLQYASALLATAQATSTASDNNTAQAITLAKSAQFGTDLDIAMTTPNGYFQSDLAQPAQAAARDYEELTGVPCGDGYCSNSLVCAPCSGGLQRCCDPSGTCVKNGAIRGCAPSSVICGSVICPDGFTCQTCNDTPVCVAQAGTCASPCGTCPAGATCQTCSNGVPVCIPGGSSCDDHQHTACQTVTCDAGSECLPCTGTCAPLGTSCCGDEICSPGESCLGCPTSNPTNFQCAPAGTQCPCGWIAPCYVNADCDCVYPTGASIAPTGGPHGVPLVNDVYPLTPGTTFPAGTPYSCLPSSTGGGLCDTCVPPNWAIEAHPLFVTPSCCAGETLLTTSQGITYCSAAGDAGADGGQ